MIRMKQTDPAVYENTNSLGMERVIIAGLPVSLTRKKIKHIHLRVCPPDGSIRVSAPLHVSLEIIEEFITHKFLWIEKTITAVQSRKPITTPVYKDGEKHYFLGQPYTLHITECTEGNAVRLRNAAIIEILINKPAAPEHVEKIVIEWYRRRLKELIPGLLAAWEPVMGVHALEWGVKRMKTRWGSCNPAKKRIWLSLELIKRPISCLEYILVHELTHLLEPSHNAHFYTLMDSFMPDWRDSEKKLREFGRNV